MTWVVRVVLSVDGVTLPGRNLLVDSRAASAAIARGVVEAIRLAGLPRYSSRISDLTVSVRPERSS